MISMRRNQIVAHANGMSYRPAPDGRTEKIPVPQGVAQL